MCFEQLWFQRDAFNKKKSRKSTYYKKEILYIHVNKVEDANGTFSLRNQIRYADNSDIYSLVN